MRLAGLQKLTLLDYPGRTAATVFVPGCSFRCPFCHNAALVIGTETGFPSFPEEDLFAFLEKRIGLIDGVCITGGEPLMQPDIASFCARVKAAGFAVKLDTNGSRPDALRDLVETGFIDYVALDVKNAPERYGETIGIEGFDASPIAASIDFLLEGRVPCEFRTTVVKEFHGIEDLRGIARWIAGCDAWFLQGFVDAPTVIAGSGALHGPTAGELDEMRETLLPLIPTVRLRGTG